MLSIFTFFEFAYSFSSFHCLYNTYCKNKEEMASQNAYLSEENKEKAIQKLKMAATLQYTMPGVPCL